MVVKVTQGFMMMNRFMSKYFRSVSAAAYFYILIGRFVVALVSDTP